MKLENKISAIHTGNGTGPSRITNPSIMCVRMHESGLSGSLLITVKGLSAGLCEFVDAVIAIAVLGFTVVDCETVVVDGATTAAGKATVTGGCGGNEDIVVAVTQVGVTVADGGAADPTAKSCETVTTASGRAADTGTDCMKVWGTALPTTLTSRPSAVTDSSGIEAAGSNPVVVGAGFTNCPLTSDGDNEADSFRVSVKTLGMSVEKKRIK